METELTEEEVSAGVGGSSLGESIPKQATTSYLLTEGGTIVRALVVRTGDVLERLGDWSEFIFRVFVFCRKRRLYFLMGRGLIVTLKIM